MNSWRRNPNRPLLIVAPSIKLCVPCPNRRRTHPFARSARTWLCVICAAAFSAGATASAAAVGAHVVRIDGSTVDGEWRGSPDGFHVVIKTGSEVLRIPLDDLATVTFDTKSAPPRGHVVFYLADGSRLFGELVSARSDKPELAGSPTTEASTNERIVGRTVLGEAVGFSFDDLAGLKLADRNSFTRADDLFHEALASRLPGQDVLITRSAQQPHTLRGRLESFGVDGGTYHFAQRSRSILTENVFGIVFAAGVTGSSRAKSSLSLMLADGSALFGRIERPSVCGLSSSVGAICVVSSVNPSVALPLSEVMEITVYSDRVVFVSDLTPTQQRVEGLLHQPIAGKSPWPIKLDRSVTGGSLAIDGRHFTKGLGVHSRTELSYELGGAYEKFAATIGLDDSVRPRGSMVFRVMGRSAVDAKPTILFDSGTVTGKDAPRDIIVALAGTKLLTLLVDYGDDLDLADAAVWGNARVLKPHIRNDNKTSTSAEGW